MANLTDGIVETANAQNIAYVAGAYFDVYVDLVSPAVITAYNIAPQGVINTQVYNTPISFVVKASNNASTWTTIATFNSISQDYPNWNAGTFRVFSFSNTVAYRYWRLESTNTAGVAISEWNLTGTTTATVKGGLVWLKNRTSGAEHWLADTIRGAGFKLSTNSTGASVADNPLTSFNANGFTTGPNNNSENNASGQLYTSWTFAEQPKFFDIVTWSGNSTAGRQIPHNLGSTPGMVIVKSLSADQWTTWHRSLTSGNYIVLNSSAAQTTAGAVNRFGNGSTTVDPTSTNFTVGSNGEVNESGKNYVAYLFAHNAGGFGPSGNDNVISCGSFTSNSSGGITTPVNLGFEPQWLLVKNRSADGWRIQDVMRGWSQTELQDLSPNGAEAERALNNNPSYLSPTATGFSTPTPGIFTANNTFVYVAIRRPTGVPTLGTQVYNATTFIGDSVSNRNIATGGFSDIVFSQRPSGASTAMWTDRLRGGFSLGISTNQGDADSYWTLDGWYNLAQNSGYSIGGTSYSYSNANAAAFYSGSLKRAAGFCDVVCYTGTGSATTQAHNLTVAPELMIVKRRTSAGTSWAVWATTLTADESLALNTTASKTDVFSVGFWNSTFPTSSVFSIGSNVNTNGNGQPNLAYLFATCPGVSKVGSFTGTGGTQTINCGFGAAGARWLLVKRTDSTGDWYNFNSSFGFTSSSSPYLTINNQNAQVTGNNGCYADSTGFTLTSAASSTVNINGASYIFLAIA
jgi:hypothetical protein